MVNIQSPLPSPHFTMTQLHFLDYETLVATAVVWRSPSWSAQRSGVRSPAARARGMVGGVRAAGFAGGLGTLRAHRAKGAQRPHLAAAAQPAVRTQSEGDCRPERWPPATATFRGGEGTL